MDPKCGSCGGRCFWSVDAWVCTICGDEWYPDHGERFAPPGSGKTAHDLAADEGWRDHHEAFRVGRGTVEWEHAEYPTEPRTRQYMHRVKISRLVPLGMGKVRVYVRYVDPQTPVVMVPPRS